MADIQIAFMRALGIMATRGWEVDVHGMRGSFEYKDKAQNIAVHARNWFSVDDSSIKFQFSVYPKHPINTHGGRFLSELKRRIGSDAFIEWPYPSELNIGMVSLKGDPESTEIDPVALAHSILKVWGEALWLPMSCIRTLDFCHEVSGQMGDGDLENLLAPTVLSDFCLCNVTQQLWPC